MARMLVGESGAAAGNYESYVLALAWMPQIVLDQYCPELFMHKVYPLTWRPREIYMHSVRINIHHDESGHPSKYEKKKNHFTQSLR